MKASKASRILRCGTLWARIGHFFSRRQRLAAFRRQAGQILRIVGGVSFFILTLLIFAALWLALLHPAYTSPPLHYRQLEDLVKSSTEPGPGNPNKEKIFIAANIVNAELVDGKWGDSLVQLVGMLGPKNVFVSIYENDSGRKTAEALERLDSRLSCPHLIVTRAHLDISRMDSVRHPKKPTARPVKRIEYLSHVRNEALRPLDTLETTFNRLLFLNDVYYEPISALHLLFSTNAKPSPGSSSSNATIGRAAYNAACAVDFVSTTNFYDSYATRDSDGFGLGYGPGFRIFPWYSRKGSGRSRREVLRGSDAVPVKSCWGGMTAFDARFFQGRHTGLNEMSQHQLGVKEPLRFRSTNEPFWDASECCLIHADIAASTSHTGPGIYQNPYVRVANDPTTFRRLNTVKRYERGFSILQDVMTFFSPFPYESERRTDEPRGEKVQRVWVYEDDNETRSNGHTIDEPRGHYKSELRSLRPGGFCGMRENAIMKDDFVSELENGKQTWEWYPAPGGLFRPL